MSAVRTSPDPWINPRLRGILHFMRIGIDARGLRPSPDGIGRYTKNLLEGLLEAGGEHEYVLFALPEIDFEFLPQREDVRLVRYPRDHLSLKTVFGFGDTVRGEGLDVLHIPFFVGPWKPPAPTVVTVHDLMALTRPRFFSGRSVPGELAASSFHRLFVPHTIRCAGIVLADSVYTKGEILRVLKLPEARVRVVYPFVDEVFRKEVVAGDIEKAKQSLGIAGPYLLFPGNTKPYKNVPGLLRGFGRFRDRLGDAAPRLVIVGPEDRFRREVEREAARLGLTGPAGSDEGVLFRGQVPDENLVALLAGATALTFPSIEEGFGLPVLEAMTVGTPVVTSNTSSLPEVAGEAAMLVDPGDPRSISDALERVSTDEALRTDLIRKGRQQAERFSREDSISRILEAYQMVSEGIQEGIVSAR